MRKQRLLWMQGSVDGQQYYLRKLQEEEEELVNSLDRLQESLWQCTPFLGTQMPPDVQDPPSTYSIHRRSMNQWKTNMTLVHKEELLETGPIRIKREIFQGDSLSPLLFTMSLNPLSQELQKTGYGYQLDEQTKTCATYNHYRSMWQDSCKKALVMVRDTHWWALAAAALLEENIKHLSHSVNCWWFGSHRQSGSHKWSGGHRCRSQPAGHPLQTLQVEACHGYPVRWTKSPSPPRMRWLVTFEETSLESSPERNMAVKELLP